VTITHAPVVNAIAIVIAVTMSSRSMARKRWRARLCASKAMRV
jgi:hypothetical protein